MDNDTAALQLQVLSQFPNLTLEDVMKILFFMESNVTVGSVTLTNVTFANATQHYCQFNFRERYKWVHFRLAVCIAVTGVLTNLLTVSTLTRRTMTTPTNLLLLGLAVADLLVEVEYIPYATSTLVGGDQLMQAKEHALYVLIHAHLSHVCHTIAIWLTVTLAVWRWVAVCRPHSAPTLCTMVYARRVLLAVYLACPALATPTFLMYTVNEYPDDAGSKVYRVEFSSFALAHNELLKKINLLVYSVLVKLVPCLLLAVLMPAIIRGMWMAKRRRQRLQECRRPSGVVPAADGGGKVHADPPSANTLLAKTERRLSRSSCGSNKPSAKKPVAVANGTDHPKPHSNREGATERTTSMLLVVMLLFLLTEAPQGVLTGLSLVYGHNFFSDCYIQLGDVMDLLALINSSINFVLYCVMSKQFRDTFVNLYCRSCVSSSTNSQAASSKSITLHGHNSHI
ncbi:G-protein coupled receptor dmsr-1 [Procambarus clarkii]|uniref:G-protein coupled receptor dmsr-1 n=1 Tax=Procambarus clarkii TaxID=6728 RepID=UPI003743543C